MQLTVQRSLREVIQLYTEGNRHKLLIPFKTLREFSPETLTMIAIAEAMYSIKADAIKYPVILKQAMGRIFDLLTLQACEAALPSKDHKKFVALTLHSTITKWGLKGLRRLLDEHVGDATQPRVLRPLLTKKFNRYLEGLIKEANKLKNVVNNTICHVVVNNPAYFTEVPVYTEGKKSNTVGVISTFTHENAPPSMLEGPIPFNLQDLDIDIAPGSVLEAALKTISNYQYTLDGDMCDLLSSYVGYERRFSLQLGLASNNKNRDAYASARLALREGIAEWNRLEDKAYFSGFRVDHRGRLYMKGFISSVTNAACKSLLRAAHGERLGNNGLRNLHIGVANVLGHDKVSFDERAQIGAAVQDELAAIAEFMLFDHFLGFMRLEELNPDDIFALASFALEFYRISKHDGPIEDYVCNLFVEQDATTSGIQHLSALARDFEVMKASNVCRDEHSSDAVADTYAALGMAMLEEADDDHYFCSLSMGERRKVCKPLTMTYFYGATKWGMVEDINEMLANLKPGESGRWKNATAIVDLFIITMLKGTKFSNIRKIQDCFKDMARAYLNQGEHYSFTLPAVNGYNPQPVSLKAYKQEGFKLKLHIGDTNKATVRYFSDDLSPHVREEPRQIDRAKELRASSPSSIHAFDALFLQCLTLKLEDATTLLTHDCMGVLPNRLDDLHEAVRATWTDIYSTDIIRQLVEECYRNTGIMVEMPEFGDKERMLKGFAASKYSFC